VTANEKTREGARARAGEKARKSSTERDVCIYAERMRYKERDRERERKTQRDTHTERGRGKQKLRVCVCDRERTRERERLKEIYMNESIYVNMFI